MLRPLALTSLLILLFLVLLSGAEVLMVRDQSTGVLPHSRELLGTTTSYGESITLNKEIGDKVGVEELRSRLDEIRSDFNEISSQLRRIESSIELETMKTESEGESSGLRSKEHPPPHFNGWTWLSVGERVRAGEYLIELVDVDIFEDKAVVNIYSLDGVLLTQVPLTTEKYLTYGDLLLVLRGGFVGAEGTVKANIGVFSYCAAPWISPRWGVEIWMQEPCSQECP